MGFVKANHILSIFVLVISLHNVQDGFAQNVATGATGFTGPQGRTGATGYAGRTGATGQPGSRGRPGELGPPGPSGLAGSPGVRGAIGATGATGSPGRADGQQGATGYTGQSGEPGVRGRPGPPGPPGAPGQDIVIYDDSQIPVGSKYEDLEEDRRMADKGMLLAKIAIALGIGSPLFCVFMAFMYLHGRREALHLKKELMLLQNARAVSGGATGGLNPPSYSRLLDGEKGKM